jgi:hypothetical protein
MIYSYFFLSRTNRHKERRPWEFLFIASVVFFIFELLSIFTYLGFIQIIAVDILFLSKIFEFVYSGFVLLAFISQNDLVIKNHLILISKKDRIGDEEKKQIHDDIDKKINGSK